MKNKGKKSKKEREKEAMAIFLTDFREDCHLLDNVSELFGGEVIRDLDKKKEVSVGYRTGSNTTEILRKNSGNKQKNTTEILRKNSGNTTGENREYYGNTPGQTTDEKRKYSGNTPEMPLKYSAKIKDINLLSGYQKSVFLYFVERAKFFGSEGEDGWRITPQISASEIAKSSTGTSVKKTRDVIRELVKSNIILKKEIKHGPGGWTIYALQPESYSKALVLENYGKTTDNIRKYYGNTTGQTTGQTTEMAPSSSSYLINKNKTTTTEQNNYVSQWLKTLDLKYLINYGITNSTVNRCFELYPDITPEKVDDLIYRFNLHLNTVEGKKIKSPRGFFISLAKQVSEGITPLDDIETSEDEYLKSYVKEQETKKARNLDLEKKALEFEFESWLDSLSHKEKDELVPPSNVISSGSHTQTVMIKQHFQEQIWPQEKEKIMRGDK